MRVFVNPAQFAEIHAARLAYVESHAPDDYQAVADLTASIAAANGQDVTPLITSLLVEADLVIGTDPASRTGPQAG